jgi:DNA invertase Pin-like site-specific DNA recombinase
MRDYREFKPVSHTLREAIMKKAVAYYRTSSMSNVGEDKDSLKRQQRAVEKFAKQSKIEIVFTKYDAGQRGTTAIEERQGIAELLKLCQEHSIDIILVENASRFSRDLIVQESGYQKLKELGIQLIPVDAPDFFNSDDPSRVLIRQMFGAVSQFEKSTVVAKLAAARAAKRKETGNKVEGRKSYAESNPELVKAAKKLSRYNDPKRRDRQKDSKQRLSLRKIADALFEQGFTNSNGKPLSPSAVKNILSQKVPV